MSVGSVDVSGSADGNVLIGCATIAGACHLNGFCIMLRGVNRCNKPFFSVPTTYRLNQLACEQTAAPSRERATNKLHQSVPAWVLFSDATIGVRFHFQLLRHDDSIDVCILWLLFLYILCCCCLVFDRMLVHSKPNASVCCATTLRHPCACNAGTAMAQHNYNRTEELKATITPPIRCTLEATNRYHR